MPSPNKTTSPMAMTNQRTFSSSSLSSIHNNALGGSSTPTSRRVSTAKLASSPFKTNADNATNSIGNQKSKMSVINSALHQSPSTNSVFSLTSGNGSGPSSTNFNPNNLGDSHSSSGPHYLPNTHIMLNRGGSASELDFDIPNFGVDTTDYDLINEVHKHLVSENALQLPGGDITRDLYKFTSTAIADAANTDSSASSTKSNSGNGRRIRRSSSFSLAERRGSLASGINVPGGFRREYLIKKKKDEIQKNPSVINNIHKENNNSSNKNAGEVGLPPFLTRNFMEFLSIYGHFAGEELEDDDFRTCTLSNSKILDEESAPLLGGPENGNYSAITNPLENSLASLKRQEATATPLKAFFLLLKSFIGTGILFLPKAFYNGGLLFSASTLLFFAIYSFWCYYILIKTKDAIKVSSFGDMGYKLFGHKMKFLIIFSIILSQIGFVGAYLVFTSTNLQAFIYNIFNLDVELHQLILAQCLLFVPLSLVRNITKLSLTSLVANLFIFIGLIVIIYYTVMDVTTRGFAPDIAQFNKDNWSLFIGVAIFAFEGIGLIIPIQESMVEPQKFPKVLFFVILTVSLLMLLVGTLCYSAYGSHTNTVIILNLPQESLLVNLIQLFYSMAILLSAPLQLFPVIKIIENRVFGKNYSGKANPQVKWAKNSLRASLVVTCCVIAYFGSSNLDKFVSFIGCFACIPLVYMYPPMLHYRAVSKTRAARALDVSLVIFGGAAMVYVLLQLI